jgi:hypothetical protein
MLLCNPAAAVEQGQLLHFFLQANSSSSGSMPVVFMVQTLSHPTIVLFESPQREA